MSRFISAGVVSQSTNQSYNTGLLTGIDFKGIIDCDTNYQLHLIANAQVKAQNQSAIYDADTEQARRAVVKPAVCAAVIEVD